MKDEKQTLEILRLLRVCEDYANICSDYERELKELRKMKAWLKERDGKKENRQPGQGG